MYCPCPLPIFVLSPLYCDGFGIILLLFLIRSSDGGFDPSDTSFSAGVFFKSLCLNGTSILLSPCAPIVVFFFQPLLSPQGFDVLSDLSVHPRPLYIRGRPAASKAAIPPPPPLSPRCTGLGNGKQRGHWRGQGLRGCLREGRHERRCIRTRRDGRQHHQHHATDKSRHVADVSRRESEAARGPHSAAGARVSEGWQEVAYRLSQLTWQRLAHSQ